MKTLCMIAALAAAPVWAQDAQTLNERVQRIIQLKYLDPFAAQNLLHDFGVEIRADRQLKVVALTGRRANVQTAEGALKQLDIPGAAQKDIDLTAYFVVGRTDAGRPDYGPIPAELESTVTALKQTFPYKSYELMDTLALRARAGSGAGVTGQVGPDRITTLNVGAVNLEGDGSTIRIERLRAGLRQPRNLQAIRLGSETNKGEYIDVSSVVTDILDVKEGQKLVVGRSSVESSRALFVVLIGKVAP